MKRRRSPTVVYSRIALLLLLVATVVVLGARFLGIISNTFILTYVVPIVLNIMSSALVIIIGLPFLQNQVQNWIQRSQNRELLSFWSFNYGHPINIVYGSQEVLSRNKAGADPGGVLSVYTASSYNRLQQLVNNELFHTTNLEFTDASRRDDKFWRGILKSGNTIILGGDRSVPLTIYLLKALGASHVQDCVTDPTNRVIKGGGEFRSRVDDESQLVSDACLVTRIRPADSGVIMIVSGNYGLGTLAAIEYLSDPQLLVFPDHQNHDVQQMVLTIPNVEHSERYNPGEMGLYHVFNRSLTSREWSKIVDEALKECATFHVRAANDATARTEASVAVPLVPDGRTT